jgi:hypothetical protein
MHRAVCRGVPAAHQSLGAVRSVDADEPASLCFRHSAMDGVMGKVFLLIATLGIILLFGSACAPCKIWRLGGSSDGKGHGKPSQAPGR